MKTEATTTHIWITKYALTEGITEGDAIITGEGRIASFERSGYKQYFHGEGREWHRTSDAAIRRAVLMRHRKIVSLEKQIKRLRGLRAHLLAITDYAA